MDDKHHKEREHFFGAAKLVALFTLISRLLGMVREMAITWLGGATRTNDAFFVAFAIPNLFRRLFGEGAMSAAFVPVFTETIEADGIEKAGKILANAFCLLSVFLSGLAGLVVLGLIVWGTLSAGNWDRQLMLLLTGIMMPFMVTVCLLALGSAALNCVGHFAYPAIAPIILNVFMIIGAMLVAPFWPGDLVVQLYAVAGSVTAAGLVQLAVLIWLLKRNKLSIRSKLFPVEGGVKRMVKIMGPMLLGFGLLQISSLFDYVVAWLCTVTPQSPTINLLGLHIPCPLQAGVLVRYTAANRLYQFPMGVLAISLGTAIFPLLSRYAARGDTPNLRIVANRAVRLSIMEGLATGTGMFVLAEPIIRLLYRHGQFTADNSIKAAFILKMYLPGMWAFCSYQIFLRAFYCMKDTMTPLKISCCLVVLYMSLVSLLVWVPSIGEGAFGLAAATTASINVIMLAIMLRRKIGRIGAKQLLVSISRSLLACLVMATIVLQLRAELSGAAVELIAGVFTFHPLLHLRALPNSMVVAACVPAGAVSFILSAWLLRAPELGELFGALRKGKTPQT